jgi:hypothetical protein
VSSKAVIKNKNSSMSIKKSSKTIVKNKKPQRLKNSSGGDTQ